jgi:6-phosphofructokinase 1
MQLVVPLRRGNPVLQNFAKFLQKEMKEKLADTSCDIKYIDPTYMVRATPTNSSDAIYCSILGQNAVHGAFAGLTGTTVVGRRTLCILLPAPTPRLIGWNMCRPMRRLNDVCVSQ